MRSSLTRQRGAPAVIENLIYPLPGEELTPQQREDAIIEAARALNDVDGVDLLKLEYPGSIDGTRRLATVLTRPWAVLSAGVPFEQFAEGSGGLRRGWRLGLHRGTVGVEGVDRSGRRRTGEVPRRRGATPTGPSRRVRRDSGHAVDRNRLTLSREHDSDVDGTAPWLGEHAVEAIVVCGVPGSGKTTFARGLARRLRWALLDLDTLTNPLFQYAGGEFLVDVPSPDLNVRASINEIRYTCLFDTARENLALGINVILVAPFTSERIFPEAWARLTEAPWDT